MRWSGGDTVGLMLAVTITTAPLAAVTWFRDNMSKDGPIGLPAYLLSGVIGLGVAGLSSAAAFMLARSDPRCDKPSYRIPLHAGCGLLAALALVVSFCVWWGD